ncbi:MAG TPA: hypothetical protein VEL07_03385 [Planctomycetota bacterium]|nr:hypothetical protein [Planctomycetota bacterium]
MRPLLLLSAILACIGAADCGGGAHLSVCHPRHVGLLPDPRWLALACIAVALGILLGVGLSTASSGRWCHRPRRRPR